jgi:DNA-binding LacI/PurR family transcriptional regulator
VTDATVYDVAKKASVSVATVSRVLNSPEKVNAATRGRVLAAIDALGFVPKADAAARARKGSGRIGVLAPFFVYPSFVQRLRGVAATLANSIYELAIYYVDSSKRRDGYLASLAITRRLDGLIVMALPFDDDAAQRLVSSGIETVLIEFAHPFFSSIEIDDEAGGRLAAEYLVSKGHRRCAFIGDNVLPDYSIRTSDRRLNGYRNALLSTGIPLPDAYISLAPHGLEQARQQAHLLLALPEPPSAIFVASDNQAIGVLRAARELSISVPQQLAVIGFDDLEISDHLGLTTVRQPLEESGRVAVELMLARLADRSRHVQHVKLPLSIMPRETA